MRRPATFGKLRGMGSALPPGPAVLCVAHPGHELRVHAWLGLARPRVFVLTDGSGRSGVTCLPTTRKLVEEEGASPGSVFGFFSDAAAYGAILEGQPGAFTRIVDGLARQLVREGVRYVAGDAAEGYNPMHDVSRLILNAAVEIARRRGCDVANFEFPLVGPPADGDAPRNGGIDLFLTPEQFERKLAAARRHEDLGDEVGEALRSAGADAFRRERLRPAARTEARDGLADEIPFYERHGERRVAAGKYGRVLRRQEHVLPLARRIWTHVEATCP